MATTRLLRRSQPAMGLYSIAVATGLVLSLAIATPVQAGHTEGRLDCGDAGAWEVDGSGLEHNGFGAPGPWSGLFLLEGTTQVFKAFSIAGFPYLLPAKAKYPKDLLTCTLTSEGIGFPDGSWELEGILRP